MRKTLTDAELVVMGVIWDNPGLTSEAIAAYLMETRNWSGPAVYTRISRCEKKGAIAKDPDTSTWQALIDKKETQKDRAEKLVDTLFGGSSFDLISAFVKEKSLSDEEVQRLKELIKELDGK